MLIDGKKIAAEIQDEIRESVHQIKNRKPCLAVILVGEHSASEIYVSRKLKACESVGILSKIQKLPSSLNESRLIEEIESLNHDPLVDGILVQLPLPAHIDPLKITQAISPAKDVDGFHPINMGKLLIGEKSGFAPCTPLGIIELLVRSKIPVAGKHVLVIGRSNIVGKPIAALLMQNTDTGNATVTVANRHTPNLKRLCHLADIIIVASGQPKLIQADMVKDGTVIIDVGINKVDNPHKVSGYQIVGDVDFEEVKEKCAFITPVPGGVGPMTIAMLLSNTLLSYRMRQQNAQN